MDCFVYSDFVYFNPLGDLFSLKQIHIAAPYVWPKSAKTLKAIYDNAGVNYHGKLGMLKTLHFFQFMHHLRLMGKSCDLKRLSRDYSHLSQANASAFSAEVYLVFHTLLNGIPVIITAKNFVTHFYR